MAILLLSLMSLSSFLITMRLVQRFIQKHRHNVKPLYNIRTVDNHAKQKIEIEQFVGRSKHLPTKEHAQITEQNAETTLGLVKDTAI